MLTSKRTATTLALLMVAVLACGGEGDTATGSPSTTAAAETTSAPAGPTLTIEGRSFGQAPEVAPGGSFTIINLDSARHTLTSSDGSWEELDLPADSQVQFTVPDSLAPGRYVFFCAVHSDMGGSLTVSG